MPKLRRRKLTERSNANNKNSQILKYQRKATLSERSGDNELAKDYRDCAAVLAYLLS